MVKTQTDIRYEAVIGLEVHAQLTTESKIFCGCSTGFGGSANSQTCPICLGMPGVLPVLNRRVLRMAVKTGLALNGRISPYSRFARKNYFYPDLPKGYQISQYELPICENGYLDIPAGESTRRIRIRRVHMEEDAGKNLHEGLGAYSHIDLNRAGTPLLEIVTEPDLRTVEESVTYLKALRDILVYLEVCDGNMEQGSLRCEPNLSLRPQGESLLGTRVEIKNINSFRFVQKAMEYELRRQEKVLREGGRVAQETRLWDTEKEITVVMRGKEEARDYRYFPEPDLVPLVIPQELIEEIRRDIPELPQAKRERFIRQHGLPPYDAEILTASRELAAYFERCVELYPNPKTVSNWIMTELLRELNRDHQEITACPIPPDRFIALLRLIDDGTINQKIGKSIFEEMYKTGLPPDLIIREKGLTQLNDDRAIEQLVEDVLKDHPDEMASYRQGKIQLLGFFVGQVIKRSQGKANPGKANEILKRKLKGD